MIDLTRDEQRFLDKQSRGSKALDEQDRTRAIEAAQERQARLDRGEPAGDSVHLAALKATVEERRLDHSIRLKNLRHHANWNWHLIELAATLSLGARYGSPRTIGLVTDYLVGTTPKDAIATRLAGSDEANKFFAQLFTESLSFAAGFEARAFRWNDRLDLEDVYADTPGVAPHASAGTWTLSNMGSGAPLGLTAGTQATGYYLDDGASGGSFVATSLADPVSGSWRVTESGFTIECPLGNLSGHMENDGWIVEGASGTLGHAASSFASLSDQVTAMAVAHHAADETIAYWFDRVVDPKNGSAVICKALLANLASASEGGV